MGEENITLDLDINGLTGAQQAKVKALAEGLVNYYNAALAANNPPEEETPAPGLEEAAAEADSVPEGANEGGAEAAPAEPRETEG